jgi:hypothetical protein
MSATYEVRFWEIKTLKTGKRRYGVRWITGSKRHSRYVTGQVAVGVAR